MSFRNIIYAANPRHRVDFRFSRFHEDDDGDHAGKESKDWTMLQLRLESVAVTYLHRMYKQMDRYIRDHVLPPLLWSPLPQCQEAAILSMYATHGKERKRQ
jgi:hypothetical protein